MTGVFGPDLLAASIRIATPLILAAMGGIFCMRARVFNIALEGFMLVGAFAAIVFVDLSGGSAVVGLLGGALAGTVIAGIYALAVVRFKADQIVAAIAINVLALGGTSFFLKSLFGISGAFRPLNLRKLPSIDLGFIGEIPILGELLSGHTPTVYFAFLVVILAHVTLFRTPFGLAVRSVGEHEAAARSVGLSPEWIKVGAILASGVLAGIAGAHISTSIVSEFTEDMIQGRGFTAFTAIVFGAEYPVLVFLASLLFGAAEALGIRIEIVGFGLPSSILKMFPYILAVVALVVGSAINKRRRVSS
jgi:general nucleoside transport system permease protein